MSDSSATRAIRKEDVERNTPGNPVEIPYVQNQEESTERGEGSDRYQVTQWNQAQCDGNPPYCQQGVVSYAFDRCRQEFA